MKSFRLTVSLPSRRRVIAERKAFLSSRFGEKKNLLLLVCELFTSANCKRVKCRAWRRVQEAITTDGGHERWKKENSVRKLLENFLYFSLEKRLSED